MKKLYFLLFLLFSPSIYSQSERLDLRVKPDSNRIHLNESREAALNGREKDERVIDSPQQKNYLNYQQKQQTPPSDYGVYFLYNNYGYRPYNFLAPTPQ